MKPAAPLSRAIRITVALAFAAVATIATMTGLLLWQLREQELVRVRDDTVRLSRIVAEQTARSLQSVDLAIDLILNRLAQAKRRGVSVQDVAVHDMLQSRVEAMPQLRSIFIADAGGRILSSALSHPAPPFSVVDRDYFVALRDRPEVQVFLGAPTTNRVDGKRTFFYSQRITAADGEFAGAIVASLDLANVEALYDAVKPSPGSPITLRLSNGTLVVRIPHDEQEASVLPPLPDLDPPDLGLEPTRSIRTEGRDAGVTTYRRVAGYPMVVAVGYRDREALAGWRETARLIVLGAAVNIVLVGVAALLLLRQQHKEGELASAVEESRDRMQAMIDSARDAIVTVDDRKVVVFNPAAQRMFGRSAADMLGQPIDVLIPERLRGEGANDIAGFIGAALADGGTDPRPDLFGLRADGSEFPVELTISRVVVGGRTLITAILRDIGDRRRAEAELRESYRQLRELAASLQTVREEERTAIARELHDELGQQLLRVRMDLSWLSGKLRQVSPALDEKVGEMRQFIAGMVDSLRRVITRLRPPLLDDLGLGAAAHLQLEDFRRQTGVEVGESIRIEGVAVDGQIAINVFRILQESLTNVARHAAARTVTVALAAADGVLTLSVSDDGRGVNKADRVRPGHGLVGIRERTLMLGGTMQASSEPGGGFVISVQIPLYETSREGASA